MNLLGYVRDNFYSKPPVIPEEPIEQGWILTHTDMEEDPDGFVYVEPEDEKCQGKKKSEVFAQVAKGALGCAAFLSYVDYVPAAVYPPIVLYRVPLKITGCACMALVSMDNIRSNVSDLVSSEGAKKGRIRLLASTSKDSMVAAISILCIGERVAPGYIANFWGREAFILKAVNATTHIYTQITDKASVLTFVLRVFGLKS